MIHLIALASLAFALPAAPVDDLPKDLDRFVEDTRKELGVVGLVLFVMLIVSAFIALRHARYRPASPPSSSDSELTQALTASLLGFVVGAFFLSLAYSEMLYTLVALAVGLQKVTK